MSPTWMLVSLLLLFAVFAIVVFIVRHHTLPRHLSAEDKAFIHVRWHELEQRMKKGGPTNFRHVIVEGDKLVEHCLKELQVPGETMGERLRAAKARFSDYQGLWEAHKVRNQLVHELDREILSFEAKKVVARFQTALHDLGAV